jgi:flagellar motor switch protein FliG
MIRCYNPHVHNAGRTIDLAESVAELRAKLQEFSQFRETTESARPFDVASTLDKVRQVLAQVAAFAHAKVDLFSQAPLTEGREARHHREILAHLAQAIAEAIDDALEAGDQLAAELVTRPAGMTPSPEGRI